jgi:hypothetical protein
VRVAAREARRVSAEASRRRSAARQAPRPQEASRRRSVVDSITQRHHLVVLDARRHRDEDQAQRCSREHAGPNVFDVIAISIDERTQPVLGGVDARTACDVCSCRARARDRSSRDSQVVFVDHQRPVASGWPKSWSRSMAIMSRSDAVPAETSTDLRHQLGVRRAPSRAVFVRLDAFRASNAHARRSSNEITPVPALGPRLRGDLQRVLGGDRTNRFD